MSSVLSEPNEACGLSFWIFTAVQILSPFEPMRMPFSVSPFEPRRFSLRTGPKGLMNLTKFMQNKFRLNHILLEDSSLLEYNTMEEPWKNLFYFITFLYETDFFSKFSNIQNCYKQFYFFKVVTPFDSLPTSRSFRTVT